MARPPKPGESLRLRWQIGHIRFVLLLPAALVTVMSLGLLWRATDGLTDISVELSMTIRNRTLGTVRRQVNTFMAWPLRWCRMTYTEWQQGHVPLQFDPGTALRNYTLLSEHLFDDTKAHLEAAPGSTPALVYVASQSGTILLYEYDAKAETLESWERTHAHESSLKMYWRNLTDNGRLGVKGERVGYDPRARGWYQQAAFYAAGQANWTNVYTSVDGTMAITAVVKLAYSSDDADWVGVAAADHTLEAVQSFLQVARPTSGSNMFIFERTGLLVATSYSSPVSRIVGGVRQRFTVTDTPVAVVRSCGQFFVQRFGSVGAVPADLRASVSLDGRGMFVDLAEVSDQYGLLWIVCLLLPRDDILGSVQRERRGLLTALVMLILSVACTSCGVAVYIMQPMWDYNRRVNEQEQDLHTRSEPLRGAGLRRTTGMEFFFTNR